MNRYYRRLQDAERDLRNWCQAHADQLDHPSMMELRLICDTIRLVRYKMKFKWE